jgi:glycosyltransferase involved in cell wall biosynthesis
MKKLSVLIPVYNQEELVINALDHLPRRYDVEVLVCDDGSTDKALVNVMRYRDENPSLDLRVYANGFNRGVAYTKNKLIARASGAYFHIHDSDDYVDTDAYERLIDELSDDGPDVVAFDLIINDGTVIRLTEETHRNVPAQIARFIKRSFVEGLKYPEHLRSGDDKIFAGLMLERHPRCVFTGRAVYHYNYPREGSLTDLMYKGVYPVV